MNNRVMRDLAAAWVAMASVIVAVPVYAQTDGQTAVQADVRVGKSEIGNATKSWLELQRTNTSAAPAQPMLGDEASLAYRRYMESFNSKIPDLYGSSVNRGSGGSTGGISPSN